MRRFTVLGVTLALCGCAAPRPGKDAQSNIPERVIVGQSLTEAHTMLLNAGAKDNSGTVGILALPPGQLRWYELRDGTYL
jgi:hypothetical protein